MSRLEDLDSILLAYTQDKIALLDEDGIFQYVNEASRDILGYDPAELVGTNGFEFIHPDDRDAARERFKTVITSDELVTETIRYRFRDAEGSWVWFESRFSNLTDAALDGYVVSSRDVSPQVTAENKQSVAESHLKETTDAVGDVVWMFSGDWEELLFINPAYEEVYGQPEAALREKATQFMNTVHPDDRACVREAMDKLSSRESVDIEYRVNPEQNYDRYVWVQGEPIVEDGEVVRIVGFTRDITERSRRERQLAVMDNLLRHNLRNDLTAIFQHADFIIEKGDEPSAKHAEIIRCKGEELLESAEKQRQIITLLSDSGTVKPIAVSEILSGAIDRTKEHHPAVEIDADVPGDISVLALHELQAAVTELLENAVQHNPDNRPEIEIIVDADDEYVRIRIEDSCPPIPEEEFRVLTGDREMNSIYHSSGMGLWLTYWIVDLSEGWIEFSQAQETGNTVTLFLSRVNDC